jgi:hypothetical protein
MARLFLPVANIKVSIHAAIASSTTYCINGLSTMSSNSLGIAFVAGKNRIPNPATGKTTFLIFFSFISSTHIFS